MIIKVQAHAEGNQPDEHIEDVTLQEKIRRIEFRLRKNETGAENVNRAENHQHERYGDNRFHVVRPKFFSFSLTKFSLLNAGHQITP